MKHKYLFLGLTFMTLVGGLTSCKEQVDVMGTSKNIAQQTIIGSTGFRSGMYQDVLSLNIVQYQFLNNNQAVRTEINWGNKCKLDAQIMPLCYEMSEFGEMGVGINLLCTPDDAKNNPYTLCFMNNELTEQNTSLHYSLEDTDNKYASLQAIDTTFTNIHCLFEDSSFWTKKVKYYDTVIVKTLTPQGVIRDTFITERERTDTICQKMFVKNYFEFYRDAATFENTGVYAHIYKEWNEDKSVAMDTTFMYDFHWGLSGIISGKKFDVFIKSDDPQLEDSWEAAISKFDPVKETITIDGNAYTIIKPE